MFLSVAIRSLNIVTIVGRPDNIEQNSFMHFCYSFPFQTESVIDFRITGKNWNWMSSINWFAEFFFSVQNMNSFELQINLLHHWNSKRSHIKNKIDRNVIFRRGNVWQTNLSPFREKERETENILSIRFRFEYSD